MKMMDMRNACRKTAQRRPRLRRFQAGRIIHWTKPLLIVVALTMVLSGCTLTSFLDESINAVAQSKSSNNLSYAVVDTGQELTYDNANALTIVPSVGSAFFGQDAQFDGNQPSYAANGDGTVTDLVTGLMWQQGYSGKMSQGEAASGASSFNLAGYSDWRLPTIKELYSLIDFSGEDVSVESTSADNPFIDTNFFDFVYGNTSAGERIIDSQWATSTIYVSGGNQMFGVNFADGRIKGYGLAGPQGTMQFYVRYVRGNTAYGENDFTNNGDGTISDLATGLMWSQDDSGTGMDWEDALAYVQDLNDANYLGYSDWYLPNAKELQSIVDYSRSPDTTNSAAIDPIFDATAITNEDGEQDWAFYWTSTTHASTRGGDAAVYIAFGRGLGYMDNQYVDVHGAGCQRSDPKSGSAIPTGRGPQGDTVRVDNYVRVVRGGATFTTNVATGDGSSGTDLPDGELAGGGPLEGEEPPSEAPDEAPNGDRPPPGDGVPVDGQLPDEELPDGQTPPPGGSGEAPDGDRPPPGDGVPVDGQLPDEELPDGQTPPPGGSGADGPDQEQVGQPGQGPRPPRQ